MRVNGRGESRHGGAAEAGAAVTDTRFPERNLRPLAATQSPVQGRSQPVFSQLRPFSIAYRYEWGENASRGDFKASLRSDGLWVHPSRDRRF